MIERFTPDRLVRFPWLAPGVIACGCILALVATPTAASETRTLRASGGLTLVAQTAEGGVPADDALTGSLDVVLSRPAGPGRFELLVEAASTPSPGGLAGRFPSSNADAGTALDSDGQGRVQISEFKYDLRIAPYGRLAVGLLDATAYLDTSPIANDETTQFLAAALVNNPTIEFPDYVPGLVYRRAGRVRVRAALTASDGLADRASATYDELFDLAGTGRGAFSALEVERGPVRVGVWVNGRDHRSLVDGRDGRSAGGIWAAVSRSVGRHTVGARLGAADRDVVPAARFASLAWRTERAAGTLGAAVAVTDPSTRLDGAETSVLVEAYWRMQVGGRLEATALVQHGWNTGFDPAPASDRLAVFGLRVHRAF